MNWVFEGRCWKLGDAVANDGQLMDFAMIKELQEYDPAKLAPLTLRRLRPEFAAQAQPGDVLVAGKRFAHGNPHIQGPLGLRGLGVGLVTEHVQRNTYRLLVSAGVPFIPFAAGARDLVEDGDRLRIDFESGQFENLTQARTTRFEPLPPFLLEIIAAGGAKAHLFARLRAAGKLEAATP